MATQTIVRSSTVSALPAVALVTCGGCDRTFGAGSVTVATGYCVCGARFPQVALPAAPDPTALCATCGVEQCRHFDGWDGSPLGCAEASSRWGGHYQAPGDDADERSADWMYHDQRCAARQIGRARRPCDCGL